MGALHLPGLEGVIAATTTISDIEPEQGNLAYRGYDIHALAAESTYEEVAYLLLYGKLPDAEELEKFTNDLAKNRELPRELIEIFKHIPPKAHPMDILRTALAFLGAVDPEANNHANEAVFRKAIRTIAKLPAAIATSYRISQHQEPISPMRQLSHAQNFLYMLSGYGPDEDAVNALDKVLILYAEHEADVSSFTARVAASSFTDYHSAITAAIGSLKGKLHGGANEQAMKMLQNIKEVDSAEEWVKDALAKKERIMGFGHRVYKNGDARARIMKQLSRALAEQIGDMKWHNLCEKIEEIVLREKGLHHNLDFYSGPILYMLGIPVELCTPIFAAGRIAGWSAHIIEQLNNNRLMRPRFEYNGPKNLKYMPIESRSKHRGR